MWCVTKEVEYNNEIYNALKKREKERKSRFFAVRKFFRHAYGEAQAPSALNPTGGTRWASLSRTISCPRMKKKERREKRRVLGVGPKSNKILVCLVEPGA